jgi:hypothetical protein
VPRIATRRSRLFLIPIVGWAGLLLSSFVPAATPVTRSSLASEDHASGSKALTAGARATAPRFVTTRAQRARSAPPARAKAPFKRRPYSDTSPWNTPIPPSASVRPDSAAGIAAIGGPREITSDPTQYTYPVYFVDATTPVQAVQLDGVFSNVRGSLTRDRVLRFLTQDPVAQVPLRDEFRAAEGSDGQIIIVNPRTGDEWGFWQLERDGSGRWTASNGYHYNVYWDGVPPRSRNGESFGSRGAGVTYFAGLIRPWEVRRGRIAHALAFAFGGDSDNDFPSGRSIYPASKSDGSSGDPNSLPEGARLQLDPSLKQKDLRALGCGRVARIMARAMQDYGMYVIDNSGSTKIMVEYSGTAGQDWAKLGVGRNTPSCIPLDRFRWIDWRSATRR